MGNSQELSEKPIRRRAPARTSAARETQMTALAMQLAEKQLREGTASAQVISHFLKLGTEAHRLERALLEEEVALKKAKTEQLKSQKNSEELLERALKAMSAYQGRPEEGE